jgi:aminopeptidase N
MQPLFLERTRGKDAYFRAMQQLRHEVANRLPVAPIEVQNSRQIYQGDVYNKGACFMHTLRWLLGDERFFRALRRMAYPDPAKEAVTDGSQIRFSDTEEMRAIVEKVWGQDLGWMFDIYLHRTALPELLVSQTDAELTLRWRVPDDLPFPMPVPVKIGDDVRRVEMPDGHAALPLTAGASVAVDPEGWLLKK